MSRTYRVRGTAKSVSRKWIDSNGNWGAKNRQEDNYYLAILAHAIFNYPCLVADKPPMQVIRHEYMHESKRKKGPDGKPLKEKRAWEDIYYWNHRHCLQEAGNLSWSEVETMIEMLRPIPWASSSIHYHPYARPGWVGDKRIRRIDEKAERRNHKMRIQKMLRNHDFDLI